MQFGFNAPTSGNLSGTEDFVRVVRGGEDLGFDYLTLSDHIVIPADISARYPYTDTGEFPQGSRGGRHEQLTTAGFVAGMTKSIRIVTSVMVVPHRPAVLTAKMLSTIDVLSGGRLTVGIGAGWLKEEFEAIDAPPFGARGAITDEYMLACKELWTSENPTFCGETVRFTNVAFVPKPVQKSYPPIWIGGESGPALRRVARLGDGWYPIGTNPQFPLDSLPRLTAGIEKMRGLVAAAGRDPASVVVAYRVQRHGADAEPLAGDGERRLLSGTAIQMADDLRAMWALGVGAVDCTFGGATAEAALDAMRRFRDDVIARVR